MGSQIYCWDFTLSSADYKYQDVLGKLKNIAKKGTFQLEQGELTGYEHFQGRISTKKKYRLNELIKLNLFKGIHWSPTSNENKNNYDYVTKDYTRVDGPWDLAAKEQYIPRQYRDIKLRKWQQEVIDISKTFNDRIINIIYDEHGNIGKSTLASVCDLTGQSLDLPPVNDAKDLLALACDICEAKNLRCPNPCFVDMPRAVRKDKLFGIYSAIEQIKKGKLYDLRYKYKEWWIDSPSIWVFTNVLPDMELLSSDRWKIYCVENDELKEFS